MSDQERGIRTSEERVQSMSLTEDEADDREAGVVDRSSGRDVQRSVEHYEDVDVSDPGSRVLEQMEGRSSAIKIEDSSSKERIDLSHLSNPKPKGYRQQRADEEREKRRMVETGDCSELSARTDKTPTVCKGAASGQELEDGS
jgi:hypothetical protein